MPAMILSVRLADTRIHDAFVQHDPTYDADYATASGRLGGLYNRLTTAELTAAMPCSRQHYDEADWRVNYSDDWARAKQAMDELEASLAVPVQPEITQAADGSWGPCCSEFYRKLEPTVDALQAKGLDVTKLGALKFMSDLQDPVFISRRMSELRNSNIAMTGRNNRDEHGSMITSLSQIFFKQTFLDLFAHNRNLCFDVSADMIRRYTDELWQAQDPQTGYWGASYTLGTGQAFLPDLSDTFHVAHYYMEDHMHDPNRRLPNLGKIVRTTLDIKDQPYPSGWLSGTGLRDHNNYDVVLLFSCGWDDAAPADQQEVSQQVKRLSDWCLQNSLQTDHFKVVGHETKIEAFYYGVRFFDTIGLWDAGKRFWHQGDFPLPANYPLTPDAIRHNLLTGFLKVKDDSDYSDTIYGILTGTSSRLTAIRRPRKSS